MEYKKELEIGKSYAAVLKDVVWEYDHIRSVYVVKFKYLLYLAPTETKEVEDFIYWWDCPNYRINTTNKIEKLSQIYNLNLDLRYYRNVVVFTSAFKWLVDTKVVITPYRYKGIKYKVICTERCGEIKVNRLWHAMLDGKPETYPQYVESSIQETEFDKYSREKKKNMREINQLLNDQFVDPYEGIEDLIELGKKESKSKQKKKK